MQVTLSRELLTRAVFDEAQPLLEAHWKEVAHFKDIPLAPDVALYEQAARAGIIRLYTARAVSPVWTEDGRDLLVGYALFFLRTNPHYSTSLQATNDVIFLDASMRGFNGLKFLRYCDTELAGEGVDAIYWHIKAFKDFGAILARMGYALVDQLYARRVGHGSGSRVLHRDGAGVGHHAEPDEPEGEGRSGEGREAAAGSDRLVAGVGAQRDG